MVLPIAGMASALNLLFIFFYFGQILHTNLNNVSEMIYQTVWYRYPHRVQRFILIIMVRARRPFFISAYGVMHCNLENFLGVSSSVIG